MMKLTEKTFTRIKKWATLMVVAGLMAACGGNQDVVSSAEAAQAEQGVMSTLWLQRSAEAAVLRQQTYDYAWLVLQENLNQLKGGAPPAVILDIDETVLDNTPYEATLIRQGTTYTPSNWRKWVGMAQAPLVPGAKEFLKLTASKGIEIFYISNRSDELLESTLNNLQKYDLPNADAKHVLLKKETSDKSARSEMVMSAFQVVLIIGDQMGDFSQGYEQFIAGEDLYPKLKGHFIVMPNPMYGRYDPAQNEAGQNYTPTQRVKARKKALQTY
ncbi:MAG: 5'-nucleotidase, lipoprotein e(P4) family [Owenweeksia sp.]|nr:5'-nucleotidase, lipoprotein e(P4) family [Owenweeksia sp.]